MEKSVIFLTTSLLATFHSSPIKNKRKNVTIREVGKNVSICRNYLQPEPTEPLKGEVALKQKGARNPKIGSSAFSVHDVDETDELKLGKKFKICGSLTYAFDSPQGRSFIFEKSKEVH